MNKYSQNIPNLMKNIYKQFQEIINLDDKKNKENYTTLKSTDSVKILKASRRKKSYIQRNNNRIADFLSETSEKKVGQHL